MGGFVPHDGLENGTGVIINLPSELAEAGRLGIGAGFEQAYLGVELLNFRVVKGVVEGAAIGVLVVEAAGVLGRKADGAAIVDVLFVAVEEQDLERLGGGEGLDAQKPAEGDDGAVGTLDSFCHLPGELGVGVTGQCEVLGFVNPEALAEFGQETFLGGRRAVRGGGGLLFG